MADEYISKQAFNNAIREAVRKCPNTFYNGLEVARQIAHDMDAADVRPVVRGRWVKSKMSAWGYRQWYECSECGEPVFPSYGHPARTNFCHNCGAKMEAQDD